MSAPMSAFGSEADVGEFMSTRLRAAAHGPGSELLLCLVRGLSLSGSAESEMQLNAKVALIALTAVVVLVLLMLLVRWGVALL